MSFRLPVPALSLLLAAGCATTGTLVAEAEVLQADVVRARAHDALGCAPVALATAEANLDFTAGELRQANPQAAGDDLEAAKAAVQQLNTQVQECAKRRLSRAPPLASPVVTPALPPVAPPPVPTPAPVPAVAAAAVPADPDRDHDGVINDRDPCPDEAGPIELLGCPLHDADGDGVPDRLDRCPQQPEDKDGFEDDDGCPDLDNDHDGVTDEKDRCPNEAGPVESLGCPTHDRDGDGIPDADDRCPDQPGVKEEAGCARKYTNVEIKDNRIEIKKQIRFRNKSAKLVGTDSFAVLSDVARALRDNPRIKRVRVEGHTDSVGNDAANLKLSQRRADAVMAQLIENGVEPGRLEAVGFGETRPIASNSSAQGRAENRRTEFNLLEQ